MVKSRSKKGFTLIELMIVIAVIAVIAALAIPALMSAQMASNERNAHASLKTLATAQIDFRGQDRDYNRIHDYWTGDVAGLFCMTSAVTPGNADEPLKLIDLSIASADTAPLADGSAAGEYRGIDNFMQQTTKAGHWYGVLDEHLPSMTDYQVDTGGLPPMGAVHNLTRFGNLAYPDEVLHSGRSAAIINESGIILLRLLPAAIKPSAAIPPGTVTTAGFKDWPLDSDVPTFWAPID